MSFNSKRVGARSSRVGKGFLGGQWKVALVALVLPMSMFVASSSGAAPKAHATAHAVTHEPVSWFRTQLAADYSLSTAGLPPTTAPSHKKGEKVWVISCGQASSGCALPTANAVTAGKALGWQMTSCDGNFGIADGYNTCIQKAIGAGANAVAIVSTDCNQAYTGMLELKAKHIALVGSEGFECDDPLGYQSKQHVFAGNILYTKKYPTAKALNEQAGRADADYLVVHFNGKVNVINSDFSVVAGEYADLGFKQELAKCASCKILDNINYTPPDTPAGGTYQTEFAAALAANPTANAAYNWPDAIVDEDGQISAVDAVGKGSSFCIVTSQDSAGPTNDAAMVAGNAQCADGAVDVVWNGYALIDEVIRALDHKASTFEGMGPVLISKGHNIPNVKSNWYYPGIGGAKVVAAYRKAWGLG